jgi:hypothetical protein
VNKADLVFKQLSELYEFNRGLRAFKAAARVRNNPQAGIMDDGKPPENPSDHAAVERNKEARSR